MGRRKSGASSSTTTTTTVAAAAASAPAPAAGAKAVPPGDVFNQSLVHRTASASANFIQYFQQEVRAILRTDLVRLPDVQHLLWENLLFVESLKLSALPGILRTCKDKVLGLPTMQEYILANIDSLPDWKLYLASRVPEYGNFIEHHPDGGLLSVLQEGLQSDSLKLPPSLVDDLANLPELCSALLKSFEGAVPLDVAELQDILSTDGNVMKDVYELCMTNVHRLPHLQQALHEHYMRWRPCLKSFQFIPSWMQDNKHVLSGYRPELLSFKRCFYSLGYIHNETGNIYTHLLGVLLFVGLSWYTTYFILHDRAFSDQLIMHIFFGGSVTCLMMSVLFHLCFVHSAHMNCFFSKLDYSGITALIFSSVLSCIYLEFYCHELLNSFYMGLTFVLAVLCAWASFSNAYRENHYKWVRVVLFISFAATGIIPTIHFGLLYGFEETVKVIGLQWVGFSCALYLTGAAVYITKFPECLFPGRFDIWFHSHQLWHCFVVAAAVAHYVGVSQGFDYRYMQMANHHEAMACAFKPPH